MMKDIANDESVPRLGSAWFDPLEAGVRQQIRSFIEAMLEEELATALGRDRYARAPGASGCRNGHRDRQLLGTFGPVRPAGAQRSVRRRRRQGHGEPGLAQGAQRLGGVAEGERLVKAALSGDARRAG